MNARETATAEEKTARHVEPEVPAVRTDSPFQPPRIAPRLVALLGCLAVIAAAALLGVRDERQVHLPQLSWTVPELCSYHVITGLDCPGCGMTRSFISLAHGRWLDAFHYHPLGAVLFAYLAAQVPFQAWQIFRIRRGKRPLRADPLHRRLILAYFAVFLAFGLWRLASQWWGVLTEWSS